MSKDNVIEFQAPESIAEGCPGIDPELAGSAAGSETARPDAPA